MLAATGRPLLAGALRLPGPVRALVLIPQVLTVRGAASCTRAVAVRAARRAAAVPLLAGPAPPPGPRAAGCAAALAVAAPDMVIATWLGLPGVGAGAYIPASNTAIMTAIPPGQAAAAGEMVNMARGLRTALRVAVVTLALHTAARPGHAPAGPAAAMAALAICALPPAWARRRVGAGRSSRAVRAGGHDSGAVPR